MRDHPKSPVLSRQESLLSLSSPAARSGRSTKAHQSFSGRRQPGAREHGFGVTPGMGGKSKVKVLLETRQTESNAEGSGYPAREVGWKP